MTRRPWHKGLLAGCLASLVIAPTALGVDVGQWYYDDPSIVGVHFFRDSTYTGNPFVASPVRDSDFTDNFYSGCGVCLTINDRIRRVWNKFSTIRICVYVDINYGTAYGPLNAGVRNGDYAFQQAKGLSSFKSC